MFDEIGELLSVVIASVVMILLGLVYFMINLWIIITGAELLGVTAVQPVLSAVLLTIGGMIASALSGRKKR